jgi:nucleoside-diphosphate-sugar epimerase
MKVILTGGTGFLGTRLLSALRDNGHEVLALARSRASADWLQAHGAKPIKGDLASSRNLKLPKADAVIHAAAHFRLAGPSRPFFRTNVEGTTRLLAAARQAGVETFVAIGAAAVVMDDAGTPLIDIDESAPVYPKSFSAYIASKARMESRVVEANAPGFKTIVLRPPGIWGPGDAFSQALPGLVKSGQFSFISRGDYPYVTCHVDNVVEASMKSLSAGKGGRAYFINDNEPVTFREFAIGIAETVGLDISRARSVPYGIAWQAGRLMEFLWNVAGARKDPPLSRTMVRLIGRPFATIDQAARAELGYSGFRSRAEGLSACRH